MFSINDVIGWQKPPKDATSNLRSESILKEYSGYACLPSKYSNVNVFSSGFLDQPFTSSSETFDFKSEMSLWTFAGVNSLFSITRLEVEGLLSSNDFFGRFKVGIDPRFNVLQRRSRKNILYNNNVSLFTSQTYSLMNL